MSDALTRVLQGNNDVGDVGACALGEGLKVNNILRELHLVRRFDFFVFVARAIQGNDREGFGCTCTISFILTHGFRMTRAGAHSTFSVHHLSCAAVAISEFWTSNALTAVPA